MGTIKHRNSKDLTEKEEIKKKWHEYTEESYKNKTKQNKQKKTLMTQITTMVWPLTYSQIS